MPRAPRYTANELEKLLGQAGWETKKGGKHVIKMVKTGKPSRDDPTIEGGTLPIGLSQAILKQAGLADN